MSRRPPLMPLLMLMLMLADIAPADIAAAGPYMADVLEFSTCDDGDYPGASVNISLVEDEELKDTVYEGDINFAYDIFCDDCEMEVFYYKWGSTGGWSKLYVLNFTRPFEYMKENFPSIFDTLFRKMGITGKPVIPGKYHLRQYKPKGLTFEKFVALPYGKYKLYVKGLKDGEMLLCAMFVAKIYEVGYSADMESKLPFRKYG